MIVVSGEGSELGESEAPAERLKSQASSLTKASGLTPAPCFRTYQNRWPKSAIICRNLAAAVRESEQEVFLNAVFEKREPHLRPNFGNPAAMDHAIERWSSPVS